MSKVRCLEQTLTHKRENRDFFLIEREIGINMVLV